MSIISENIKHLRKQMGYTQEQFAEMIEIKRSLLGAYEEGRADPRLNNLIKMSEVFNFPVDDLIKRDLTQFETALDDKKSGFKILSITVDRDDNENIEWIPQKASAGYLNGYSDPDYLRELPKFQLPFLSKNGTYRAFEINGDSMLPIASGTIIIGRYLESVKDIMNAKTYVLLTKNEGIVYKRVFNYLDERGSLYLVSDNKIYPPYEVPGNEILEIWEAKTFIGKQFPNEQNKEDLSLQELKSMVLDLQQEVVKLKDR
jgi:transcriptional regulator with XRE-family HTH domain